jgi:hypothetical protein
MCSRRAGLLISGSAFDGIWVQNVPIRVWKFKWPPERKVIDYAVAATTALSSLLPFGANFPPKFQTTSRKCEVSMLLRISFTSQDFNSKQILASNCVARILLVWQTSWGNPRLLRLFDPGLSARKLFIPQSQISVPFHRHPIQYR